MGLSLIELGKTYAGGVVGVEQLNLQVEDSELVTIVGHSGSGKSTTLRLVAGLECPSSGRVCLHGRDLSAVPVHRRRVMLVGQRPVLHPQWTVERHLKFAWNLRQETATQGVATQGMGAGLSAWWRGRFAGSSATSGYERQRDAVAEEWGVADLLPRRAAELSGGEQQRVAVARAALSSAEAFLLDEPFSAVDQPQRRVWRERVRAWQRRARKPMLYVTHDPAEALSLGDRVAVLQAGRLEQCGSPREIYRNPQRLSVARAVANSPLNVLAGRLEFDDAGAWVRHSSGLRWRCGERVAESVARRWAGRSIWWAIRAEDLTIVAPHKDAGQEVSCDANWRAGRVAGQVERVERRGDSDLVSVRLLATAAEEVQNPLVDLAVEGSVEGPKWVALAPAWSDWSDGDQVELHWMAARGMVFDSSSEARVTAVGNMLEEDA